MLTDKFLDVDLPIIQAPMAGVQGSKLALAVSRAGGLGSLPCAMLSYDKLKQELDCIYSSTEKPVNFNFFCHSPAKPDSRREARWRDVLQPYFSEFGINENEISEGSSRLPFNHDMADILANYKPRIMSFHFGLPDEKLLHRVKAWGTKVLSSATTLQEAKWLEAHGADGIIAQGLEAGGHLGLFLSDDMTTQMGTFSLLPQIIKKVSVPVIAAGGIADASGVAAALFLGARAVQIGTAYLLCSETETTDIHWQALKSEASQHTAVTNLFTGRPARGIINRIIRELGPMNNTTPEFPTAATAISALRKEAEAMGLNDFTPLWSGQNTSGCKEISATELTRALAKEIQTL